MSAARLRDALDESLQKEETQMAMVEGSRLVLQAIVREELPGAVEKGVKAAMTPELVREFAQVFITVMKEQASVKVDTWAGGLVKGLARKVWENFWLITFAVAFAYSVGGLGAVVGLGKWAITEGLK